jgi:DNA polymerase epsilon subunit 2
VDRFLLIQQRLRRHALFRPMAWNHLNAAGRRDAAELTELKALLGLVGERRYVTGFLTRQDEGRYFIEDLSARLPLDLSVAETSDGLFTENCVVVAEGELTPGGAFKAVAIGLPPAEPRAESLSALQGLDCFGGRRRSGATSPEERARWAQAYDEDRIVVMSDVHLDRPEVIANLHTVLSGFAVLDPPPSAFVLMGDFQSYDANAADTNFARIRDNFATLGRIISGYPSLRQRSQFLIVPGPKDVGPGGVFPRPPLPRAVAGPLLDAVPTARLCSNPLRLRHGPAEGILFRADMQRQMRGLCVLPPPAPQEAAVTADPNAPASSDAVAATLFDHLCATVLQEGHLCPLPLEYAPVTWEWDHAMWVYPLPHGLVLADSEPAARSVFDSCACLNPGSLREGTFGAWRPAAGEMELCDVAGGGVEVDDDEEAEEEELFEAVEAVEDGAEDAAAAAAAAAAVAEVFAADEDEEMVEDADEEVMVEGQEVEEEELVAAAGAGAGSDSDLLAAGEEGMEEGGSGDEDDSLGGV